MNIRAHYPGFKVWAGAKADIDRILSTARLPRGTRSLPVRSKALHGRCDVRPVVTRFLTYDVVLGAGCAAYCRTTVAMPATQEWIEAAKSEPDELEELDVEF
jgi:glutathione S-transferase